MTSMLLDPWSDAAAIALRLESADVRLVVIVGAEAWCEKCRTLKPAFEQLALQKNDERNLFLWLDLEDHAEFLDEFIPPSLPMLLVYSGAALSHAFIVSELSVEGLSDLLAQRERIEHGNLPDLRARLRTVDWAT